MEILCSFEDTNAFILKTVNCSWIIVILIVVVM